MPRERGGTLKYYPWFLLLFTDLPLGVHLPPTHCDSLFAYNAGAKGFLV